MKTILWLVGLLVIAVAGQVTGEDVTAKTLLRDGLFEEEANANLEKARATYELLIKRYDEERRYAGTALFRLAEIARKQGQNEQAEGLYRRVAREFADQADLAARARERLGNAAVPAGGALVGLGRVSAEEQRELDRLHQLRVASPDLLDGVDEEGFYPLHRAAQNGWLHAVDVLLEHKVSVDPPSSKARLSPLHLAVVNGHLAVVKKLLEAGADFDRTFVASRDTLPAPPPTRLSRSVSGDWSPLHAAVLYERRDVAKALLAAGVNTNAAEVSLGTATVEGASGRSNVRSFHATPLIVALHLGNERLVETLLEGGVDPNFVVKADGNSALMTAVLRAPELLPMLMANGLKVAENRFLGQTALLNAVGMSNVATIKLLVEGGAGLSAEVEEGGTSRSTVGRSVLEVAMRNVHHWSESNPEKKKLLYSEVVEYLLKKGAEPTPADLHAAVSLGAPELVTLSLEAGADANAVVERGNNQGPVLHYAATAEVAEILLEAGANLEAKNADGQTVLERVYERNFGSERDEKLADYLLSRGAKTEGLNLGSGQQASTRMLPWLAPYFYERLRYAEHLKEGQVAVAFPYQGVILQGEKLVIDGTAPPTFAELVCSVQRQNQRLSTSRIRYVRVFRMVNGKLASVLEVEEFDLRLDQDFDIRWGDLVEIQLHHSRKPSSPPQSVDVLNRGNDAANLQWWGRKAKDRTIHLKVGTWEYSFPLSMESTVTGLYLKDFLGGASKVLDLSKVRVLRREAEPLVVDCRLGVERPTLRMVDGDRIEIPLREELLRPKGTEWEGVRVFYPDVLGYEQPTEKQGVFKKDSLFSLLFSEMSWPSSRDYSKIEILRTTEDGSALQSIKVNLLGRLASIPRFEWDRDKLLALNVSLKDGDLVVIPPLEGSYWAGRSNQTGNYSGLLKEAIEFLSPGKTAGSSSVRPPQPAPTRSPTRRRVVPLPPSR